MRYPFVAVVVMVNDARVLYITAAVPHIHVSLCHRCIANAVHGVISRSARICKTRVTSQTVDVVS